MRYSLAVALENIPVDIYGGILPDLLCKAMAHEVAAAASVGIAAAIEARAGGDSAAPDLVFGLAVAAGRLSKTIQCLAHLHCNLDFVQEASDTSPSPAGAAGAAAAVTTAAETGADHPDARFAGSRR